LARGVPILHLIPVPCVCIHISLDVTSLTLYSSSFPHVWHTLSDDIHSLDLPTIRAWSMLLRIVTAEYLSLVPQSSANTSKRDELASHSL
jgi:hypothetical protein